MFRWFDEVNPHPFFTAEMSLRAGDLWVMDAHDGFPGTLQLTVDQFAALQDRLERAGLPRDLYYPLLDQREVVEPVSLLGGVVRQVRFYSPQQWAHRDADAIAAIAVPSEEERRKIFTDACHRFQQALMRRHAELHEPDKELQTEETAELGKLIRAVHDAIMLAADQPGSRSRSAREEQPLAGWSHVPTAFEALETSLPALRRLHDDGHVWQIISMRVPAGEPTSRWTVSIWLPSANQGFSYTIFNGVLFGPAQRTSFDASEATPIRSLKQEDRPRLLDSSDIMQRIEESGGRAFRERTGATLNGLRLQAWPPASLTWTGFYGRWYPRAGLQISLDAATGEVVGMTEEPTPPPSPIG